MHSTGSRSLEPQYDDYEVSLNERVYVLGGVAQTDHAGCGFIIDMTPQEAAEGIPSKPLQLSLFASSYNTNRG